MTVRAPLFWSDAIAPRSSRGAHCGGSTGWALQRVGARGRTRRNAFRQAGAETKKALRIERLNDLRSAAGPTRLTRTDPSVPIRLPLLPQGPCVSPAPARP